MPTLNLTGYHLTFDDEFNSFLPTELGGPTWNVTIFSGNNTWGSENYTSGDDGGLNAYLAAGGVNPFSVGGGVLSITATPNAPGATSNYTTGLIDNRGTFSQSYGYFEMRAELPAGAGFWPGFWTLPTVDLNDGTPEIDAMEAFGSQYGYYGGSNQVHYDLHSSTNPNTSGTWATVNANIYTSYNTYGVMWTPTTLTFYFDGQAIGSLPTSKDLIGNPGEYMIASLLTGAPGDWPGPMAGETGSLKIDYIRAFSSDSSIPAVALQTVSSPDGAPVNLYGATAAGGSTGGGSSGGGSTGGGGGTTPPPPPPPPTMPTVTISSGRGAPVTVDLTKSTTSSGDTFTVSGSTISAALGTRAQTLSFQHTATLTVKGGSGYDTVSVDGGTNDFTAGSGGMTITSSPGADTFHVAQGAGILTVDDFGASDRIVAAASLRGKIASAVYAGGTIIAIGTGRNAADSIYLANNTHFNTSSIQYQ